jgi:hypothetical protein
VAASTTAAGIPGLRKISSQTVRNLLRQHGIRPRRPYFGAVLTPLNSPLVQQIKELDIPKLAKKIGKATSLGFCYTKVMAEYVYIGAGMTAKQT